VEAKCPVKIKKKKRKKDTRKKNGVKMEWKMG